MTLIEIEKAITNSIDMAQKYLDDMEMFGELTVKYELCQKQLPHSHRLTLFQDRMELIACEYLMDYSFFTDISAEEQLTIEKTVKNYMVKLLDENDAISLVMNRNMSGSFNVHTLRESVRRQRQG